MNKIQNSSNTPDVVPLCRPLRLFLKPVASLHISVQLPQLKALGKAISNIEIMEKLRYWIQPEIFTVLKVSKNTLEFIRFDAEIENKSDIPAVLSRLNKRTIKIGGFKEQLKVRASEAKPDYPTRYDWDTFFRDAKNMNEMRPGERPDTVHISNLPCKWFTTFANDKPDPRNFKQIFEQFGDVGFVDIPILDKYRNQIESLMFGKTSQINNQSTYFDAYIQFKEYFGFGCAMDTFRGMKLLYINEDNEAFSMNIKVDFDKTKHLTEEAIRRRKMYRDRLVAKEKEREEKERKQLEEEKKLKEQEIRTRLERRKLREQIRKERELKKLQQKEAEELNKKIATEERLLLIAQRKLQSIRLLSDLFSRVKVDKLNKYKEGKQGKKSKKYDHSDKDSLLFDKVDRDDDTSLHNKLVQRFRKRREEKDRLHVIKAEISKSDFGALSSDDALSLALDDVGNDKDIEFSSYKNDDPTDIDNIDESNYGYQKQNYRGQRRGFFRRGFRGRHDWYGGGDFRNNRGRYGYRGKWGYNNRSHFNRNWQEFDATQDDLYADKFVMPYTHEYHRYFQSISGNKSHSSSYSASSCSTYYHSRRDSRYSSRSRSRSRSRRRSYSRSKTRSRSRSRRQSRSRSHSKNGSRSRKRSNHKSRSYSKSKNKKSKRSRTRSQSKAKTNSTELTTTNPQPSNMSIEGKNDKTNGGKDKKSSKSLTKHKKEK